MPVLLRDLSGRSWAADGRRRREAVARASAMWNAETYIRWRRTDVAPRSAPAPEDRTRYGPDDGHRFERRETASRAGSSARHRRLGWSLGRFSKRGDPARSWTRQRQLRPQQHRAL